MPKQKIKFRLNFITISLLLMMSLATAQPNLEKKTLNNGGATMTGGDFTLSSSIGEISASVNQTGGNFNLVGGFWQKTTLSSNDLIFKNSFDQ